MSVFRVDSMATNNKAPTFCLKGSPVLTTKTDFQASYPNTLQTSSYNFTATNNTGELCTGVVKTIPVHCKNAAQHLADLEMLEKEESLQIAFKSSHSAPKEIECIRTDSGSDEAPYFKETQFWWTKRHLEKPTTVQPVTSHHRCGSNLNRVELQNGCEAKACAGLFIPSTLNGSNLDMSGKLNNEKLTRNLEDTIGVYISRVQGATCADAKIQYYTGASSTDYQLLREKLLKSLHAGKSQKAALEKEHSDFKLTATVLDVRKHHMNKTVPSRYIFHLVCCYKKECPHPVCQKGPPQVSCWYEGGPSVRDIPLPLPDPQYAYGSNSCTKCKSAFCAGHYLSPQDAIQKWINRGQNCVREESNPPPDNLKKFHKTHGINIQKNQFCKLAQDNLLPVAEVLCTAGCKHSNCILISIFYFDFALCTLK